MPFGRKCKLMIRAFPALFIDEIKGEIEYSPARQLAGTESMAVPAKRKRYRHPVFDIVPAVKSHMQQKRCGCIDQQIATRR